MNITKRRAEEAEERGRHRESVGSYDFAKISYLNAKQLWEEAKDIEKVRDVQKCIMRVEEQLK